MEILRRKRLRSDECPYELQSKIYVNQRVQDARNNDAMNKIYNKTISMLYKGAQNLDNNNNNLETNEISQLVTLKGTGEMIFHSKDKPQGFPTEKRKAKCCGRDTLIAANCLNCNLGACEFCALSCSGCGAFICSRCVLLFECGTMDLPMCERCKMFNSHS